MNGYTARIGLAAGARVAAAPTGDDGEDLAAVVDDVVQRRLNMVGREMDPPACAAACGMTNSVASPSM